MRRKFKFIVQITVIAILIVIIVVVWSSRLRKQKSKENKFAIDLYDDEYDENERLKSMMAKDMDRHAAFKHLNMIGMPEKTRKVPPKPPVPEIFIQNNPPIVLSDQMSDSTIEDNFFKYLEAKDVICKDDQRVGYQHDGGYNVCLSPPMKLKKPCVVFSFGIGDNWLFDDAVSKIYKCKVYSFDPTINLPDHNRSALIKFQNQGLGKKNEINKRGWKMKTLGRHLQDEGYHNRKIDYVKFDIEYNEWAVLQAIFEEGSLESVKQLGFEIHINEYFRIHKLNFRTTKEDFIFMYKTLEILKKLNFRKFNYRLNPFGEYKSKVTGKTRSHSYELFYINMNLVPSNYTVKVKYSKPRNFA